MWDPVRGRLAAWTRVITPDLRGFGRTELPLSDRSPDLADAAADVVAMLDGLGLQRVVLGGCSMGGYVAMAVLRKAPERVAGVVLLDTKAEADGEQARQNRHRVAERAEREGVRDWLAAEMLGSLLGDSTRTHHVDVMEHTRDLIDAQQPSGVAWAQRAMANRPDSTETLRATTVPALVLVGAIAALALDLGGEIPAMVAATGPAVLVFNLLVILAGGALAWLSRVDKASQLALAVEYGIKNSTLGLVIALTVVRDEEFAVPAAVYSIVMYLTAVGVIFIGRRIMAADAARKSRAGGRDGSGGDDGHEPREAGNRAVVDI